MSSRPHDPSIVVGLSSNPIDPAFHAGGFDGIGVYTHALERSLQVEGVVTRRIGAPKPTAFGWTYPTTFDASFGVPLAAAIAWSKTTGRPAPFASRVEDAIDVYHSTDYLVPTLCRIPVVATIYDAIPLLHPEWATRNLRVLKNHLLRAAASAADLVIAISRSAVPEIIAAYGIPRDRIRIVPLGVDDVWFAPPPGPLAALREARGVVPGYFLFCATLQPRKNLPALLAAYDQLPEARRSGQQLVIVGRYGWGVETLRTQLLERRAEGRVIWLDYVDEDVLRTLFANASAFVFPSLSEGFGLPVLEALACGLPVICSDLPALREVAGDCARYVPPNDVAALAAAMIESVGGQSSAAKEHRRKRARTFDWKSCAQRTLEVYREAIALRKA